jgi:hypothetical protein
MSKLVLSTKRPFSAIQRWCSYFVWANVLIIFLIWEISGDWRYTPWKTLSETAWDVEKHYPGTVKLLEAFLLGLTVHIRYRTTLESSFVWGKLLEPRFNKLVEATGGDFA